MLFPKSEPNLDEIFKQGKKPQLARLKGEYSVDMLTGFIPSFRWAGHAKRFFKTDTGTKGYNVVLGGICFGYFSLEEGVCPDFYDQDVLVINYAQAQKNDGQKHNIFTRIIRDKIREIEPDVYLGRFYFAGNTGLTFKGYFSLSQKR